MLTGTSLDLTPFGPLLSVLGVAYWLLGVGLVALALWVPKRWSIKLPLATIVLGGLVYPVVRRMDTVQEKSSASQARLGEARALFAERCKGAGGKVFRTVSDVDGVLLTNVRLEAKPSDKSDRYWPDAALPSEGRADWYIRNFLLWEHHEDKRNPRGYLNSQPSTLRGYRFVDVKDSDGAIYRYRLTKSERAELSRELAVGPPSRYAVSFVNMLDPEDREKWIAGTKVLITDTVTNAAIAEHTWYSIEPGQGSTEGFRSPWEFAQTCPALTGWVGAPTRFFVDRVLRPRQGE